MEVDGDTPDPVSDAKRDAALTGRGFMTLRFGNRDVGQNVEGVLEVILAKLRMLPDRWPGPTPTQHGGRFVPQTNPEAAMLLKGRGLR